MLQSIKVVLRFAKLEMKNALLEEMNAEKITHDKIDKTIYYDNAWLQLYDKPILYFPKFFHPDPSVDRRSGF